jgi:DNA-binding NarL/FixJ family response regulator
MVLTVAGYLQSLPTIRSAIVCSAILDSDLPTSTCDSVEAVVRRMRILIADDNPAILEISSRLLSHKFDVVGAVESGEAVMRDFAQAEPDVLVLDISMGELSGFEVARRLFELGRHAKVVFLTIHQEQELLGAAFGVGGSAYVLKSRLTMDLPLALEAVLNGGIFISPNLLNARGP